MGSGQRLLRSLSLAMMLWAMAKLPSDGQTSSVPEPKIPGDWFQRASDQTNLRLLGSAPFHLRVTFHAFAGEELNDPKDAPRIITGDGVLVAKNKDGLTISWQDDTVFSGRIVPRQISIKADGLKPGAPERELLNAEVRIESQAQPDPALFDLPVTPADAGVTLRPLQGFARPPRPKDDAPHWQGNHDAAFVLWGVMDRTGSYQELEVTSAMGATDLRHFMDELRRVRFRPAEIDGAPCELAWPLTVMRKNRVDMQ